MEMKWYAKNFNLNGQPASPAAFILGKWLKV
jgi:hypothetical protein